MQRVTADEVGGFLAGLLGGGSAAAAEGAATGGARLRLHPAVDAEHPLGESHSELELQAALRVYDMLLPGARLELGEVLVAADGSRALATAHVLATSPLVELARLAAELLPVALARLAAELLPSVERGRVPAAVALRIGKNDAGEPVVVRLSVSFCLLAALLPHLAPQPWQAKALRQAQPAALQALLAAGSLAAVLEDVGTSAAAAWRAAAAVVAGALGPLAAELLGQLRAVAGAALPGAAPRRPAAPGGGAPGDE